MNISLVKLGGQEKRRNRKGLGLRLQPSLPLRTGKSLEWTLCETLVVFVVIELGIV